MKQLARAISSYLLVAVFVVPTAAWPQQQSGAADDVLRSAQKLYREGKLDAALAACLKASELNPNDYRSRALAGFIYAAQQKHKSSSDAFAEAIRLEPRNTELYLIKAQVDVFRNAHAEAMTAVRKAIQVDPNYAEAHAMLGDLLAFYKDRTNEAIHALRTAIRLNPKLPQPYESLGNLLADTKDEKGAEDVFRRGMAADPKHMVGRFPLGRLLVKQGRLAEARKLWDERTSDQDNTFPQFIQLLTRAENLKRATDALAKNPNDPEALVDMGLAVMDGDHWVLDGRQRKALVYFQKALKLKPNYARAQYGIVKAYIQGVNFAKDESKIVDAELAKLRKLDARMAAELDEYRKTYVSGLIGTPV